MIQKENLIYILFERNIHKVSSNIEEIFQDKISDERLVVFDMDKQETIFSNYISEDTIDDAIEEVEEVEIPLLKEKLEELKNMYDERRRELKVIYKKQEDERAYAIYLKIKERIENGEIFGEVE